MTQSLRIGLTGGIGSGKTTVSNFFSELGVPVIDADEIAHQLVKKGRSAYNRIIEAFGQEILDNHGELDRRKLRERVFKNLNDKERLEGIIHPEVRKEISTAINRINHPYCIISIPLLIESDLQHTVDRILVLDVAEHIQIQRACARDQVDEKNIRNILANQVSREKRLEYADDILVNDKDVDTLKKHIKVLDKQYREAALTMYTTEEK